MRIRSVKTSIVMVSILVFVLCGLRLWWSYDVRLSMHIIRVVNLERGFQ